MNDMTQARQDFLAVFDHAAAKRKAQADTLKQFPWMVQ